MELSESQDLRQLSVDHATLVLGDVAGEQNSTFFPSLSHPLDELTFATLEEPDLCPLSFWQSGLRKFKYF